LPPNQRECVSLFYLNDRSYRQVSEATGFDLMKVKSYIQNGKRNMRLIIEKKIRENAS
jgi:DNA-directed RNA polymerase specialized sigma24 family protein